MEHFQTKRAIDSINNIYIRKLIYDAYKLYTNGHYRETIIDLWTISVYDMVYKIDEIINIYDDQAAKDIKSLIEREQNTNPNRSSWESILLERFKDSLYYFNEDTYKDFIRLKEKRNLCAHPVIIDLVPYEPTAQDAEKYICLVLEKLINEPAIPSRRVFHAILQDIEDKSTITDISELVYYIDTKYDDVFNNNEHLKKHFKSMWKIVFNDSSKNAEKNRKYNYYILEHLLNKYSDILKPELAASYYSKISSDYTSSGQDSFIKLLARNINIYNFINANLKNEVDFICNNYIRYALVSWFKDETIDAFCERLRTHIMDKYREYKNQHLLTSNMRDYYKHMYTRESIELLYEYLNDKQKNNVFNEVCFIIYSLSSSFDDADNKYDYLIREHLSSYSLEEFLALFNLIKDNVEIINSNRRRCSKDFMQIFTVLKSIQNFEEEMLDPFPEVKQKYNEYKASLTPPLDSDPR